jgi:glucose-6-phosphate isomerase
MKCFHQKSFQEIKKDIQETLYRCCKYRIGGSGFREWAVEALQYYRVNLKVHFVSNVDGDHVNEVIKN